MHVTASLKSLRIAPRKVRLVTHAIVGLSAEKAVGVLDRLVKRSAPAIGVLLKSAMANATNNFDLDVTTLKVKEVRVGDGARLKRYMPKAFGQATQILKRSSKIEIILEGEVATRPVKTKVKKTVKTETVEAEKTGEKLETPSVVTEAEVIPEKMTTA